ncbi:MAG: hypothetical protein HKN32_07465, partial [Flavobacteriales bacterium]|nr:hypothetical protein [Flavobacteriales bacterium]
MKIRIKGNSLRLRLTQSEVDHLSEHGSLMEATEFPNGHIFEYGISCASEDFIPASFTGNCITVSPPIQEVKKWAGSDKVSIEEWVDLGNGKQLRVLVEKDFACLTERTHEDESDMFPNP